jgi:hypothetical protein
LVQKQKLVVGNYVGDCGVAWFFYCANDAESVKQILEKKIVSNNLTDMRGIAENLFL